MSVYDENLLFLKQKDPALLSTLLAVTHRRCKTEPAKNGTLTLVYSLNQTPYYLHSRFNPEAESAKIIAKKDTSADHIIVMGLGLGYHLQKLMETKGKISRVLLLEPDLEIVKHSLKTLRWKKLMNRGDFFYVFGADFEEIIRAVHNFINIITFDTVEYIDLPSETRLLGDFFKKARQVTDNEIKTELYDFKTRLAESYMLPRNVLRNMPLILKTRPAVHLKDRFPGTPGFIISAGPSLDKNVLHLKKIKDRALLITVDTALKPLLKRSIQPHFTAAGDPSHKNYLHLQGTQTELQHFITAEAGIAHQVFRDFRDQIFTLSVGKPIVRLIEENSEPIGELEAWGSVISIALELAVYMGLDPIIFVGQDFAFTDTRNHCRGTSWEEKKLEYTRDLAQLQRFEKQSIRGNKKVVEINDIVGNKTFTSERLKLYKNYLVRMVEKYPHVRFINATEGGIFSEIPHMPLYEAIKKFVYGKAEIDCSGILRLPTLDKEENIRRLTAFFNSKGAFFEDYQKKIDEISEALEKLDNFSRDAALPVLAAADAVKNALYAVPQNGEIVELWSLSPIYHFLREYKRIEQKELDESYIKETVELYQTYFHNITPLIEDIITVFKQTSKKLGKKI
jgi:hypothetical protein